MSTKIRRVLIVGWDGADWGVLEPMLKAGHLPVLQRLITGGVSGPLRSTIPTHSYTAWASFMTGKNPGKHGIYDFVRHVPAQPGHPQPIDRRSIAGETFIEMLSRHGYRVGTAHIPLSFPPAAVNGFWISGMTIPEGATYTYPADLQHDLERHTGGAIADDVEWHWLDNDWEQVFAQADRVAQVQARGLFYLLDRFDWDLFTHVFVSPDRLQHVIMRLVDETHPSYNVELTERYLPRVYAHFELLDRTLGGALEQAGQDTIVLLISDHGFRSCWRSWSAAVWLRERGYLQTHRDWRKWRRLLRGPLHLLIRDPEKQHAWARRGARMLGDKIDWGHTHAYVVSAMEQGIRINLKGREALGAVDLSEYGTWRQQLRLELVALRDPDTGQPLVDRVYLREELFDGDELTSAPDLVFDFAPGVTVPTGTLGHRLVAPTGWKSGDHAINGILVAYGPNVPAGKRLEGARLIDIAPTVLHVLGAPVPTDMDGTFLDGLFASADLGTVQFEAAQKSIAGHAVYTSEEQEAVEQRLRNLGYLE